MIALLLLLADRAVRWLLAIPALLLALLMLPVKATQRLLGLFTGKGTRP